MLSIKCVREFVKENEQDIIEQKVNTYPINEENFLKWINNHSERFKSEASDLRANTIHVSFLQFTETLCKICAEIRSVKDSYKNIVLLIPDMIKKSNFWISLYMFYYLNDVITHVCYKIEGASTLKEKTLIIIPDDCSYSGTQIIAYFSIKTPHHILFAIPYISKEAKK
jgi:hypothetical protein